MIEIAVCSPFAPKMKESVMVTIEMHADNQVKTITVSTLNIQAAMKPVIELISGFVYWKKIL